MEIETASRRAADLRPSSNVRLFVLGAIFTCVFTVVAVVYLSIKAPTNTAAITTVLGITTPIMIGLLGAGIHGIATNVDGRLTQLIEMTAQKEHLQGLVEGLVENPGVNLTDKPPVLSSPPPKRSDG